MNELERKELALRELQKIKSEYPTGKDTTLINQMIVIAEQRIYEAKRIQKAKQQIATDGEAESKA